MSDVPRVDGQEASPRSCARLAASRCPRPSPRTGRRAQRAGASTARSAGRRPATAPAVALDWVRANRARARADRGRRRRPRPDRARDLAGHRLHAPALPAVRPRDPGLRRRAAREPRPRRAHPQRDRARRRRQVDSATPRLGAAEALRALQRDVGRGAAGRRESRAGRRAPHDALRGRRLRSPGAVRQRPRRAAGMAPDLPRERRSTHYDAVVDADQRRRPLPPEPDEGRGAPLRRVPELPRRQSAPERPSRLRQPAGSTDAAPTCSRGRTRTRTPTSTTTTRSTAGEEIAAHDRRRGLRRHVHRFQRRRRRVRLRTRSRLAADRAAAARGTRPSPTRGRTTASRTASRRSTSSTASTTTWRNDPDIDASTASRDADAVRVETDDGAVDGPGGPGQRATSTTRTCRRCPTARAR